MGAAATHRRAERSRADMGRTRRGQEGRRTAGPGVVEETAAMGDGGDEAYSFAFGFDLDTKVETPYFFLNMMQYAKKLMSFCFGDCS